MRVWTVKGASKAITAVAAIALAGCAVPKVPPPFSSAQDAAAACTLVDDQMATSIVLRCEGRPTVTEALSDHRVVRQLVAVAQRSGSPLSVYLVIRVDHGAKQAATFTSGTYLQADLTAVNARVSGKFLDVDCSAGCSFTETGAMTLDLSQLRAFAAAHPASTFWRARFSGSAYIDVTTPVVELQGFLAAIDGRLRPALR